jgi:peroxiredoxin
MMSRTRLAIWFLTGILVVVGLGVFAGKQLAIWRADRAHEAEVAKLHRGETSKLRVGETFPEVDLTGPGGLRTTTSTLLTDEDALIVFMSPGCDGCTEAVLRWNPTLEMHRTDLPRVLGIARAKAEDVDIYVRETGLAFPVFADEQDVFGSRYDVHAIPTVIGTRRGGRIVFIRHGIPEGFTPDTAEKLLENAP